jgi:hypothetical protein
LPPLPERNLRFTNLRKHSRPILQAKRLRSFLELKSYMRQSNRQRLKARLDTAPKQSQLRTKRLANDAIQRPQGNYRTRGAMHLKALIALAFLCCKNIVPSPLNELPSVALST